MTKAILTKDPELSAFAVDRPLLLLTDFAPDLRGGGAVNLRSLLTPQARERIVWVTLSPFETPGEERIVSLAPGRQRSPLRDATVRSRALCRMARQVADAHGAVAAWVIAHGAAVRVAPGLVEMGLPVHVTINDDPAWAYAALTRRYLLTAPLLARDLGRILPEAGSVDVVSRGMLARYQARYGIEPVIVNRGVSGPVSESPPYERSKGISVAVLGSTYGVRELATMARALARAGDLLATPARLTVIGGIDEGLVRRILPSGLEVALPGHIEEDEAVALLRASFLLYLCYPFSRRGAVLRRTSFPTKLSTYAMAARPLLVHTPTDSTVAFLGERTPYASRWSSLSVEEGARLIVDLWRRDDLAESFHTDAEQLRAEFFDLRRNRAILFKQLNSLREGCG